MGALSVHLLNGIWGTIAVGIFASNGTDITLLGQLKGIAVIGIFAFISSYIVLFIINKIMPLRADNDEEIQQSWKDVQRERRRGRKEGKIFSRNFRIALDFYLKHVIIYVLTLKKYFSCYNQENKRVDHGTDRNI